MDPHNLTHIPPIMTYKQIGQSSYMLLKETERTTNYYCREYIHRKFPNIPVTRIVIIGKLCAIGLSASIAYYNLTSSDKDTKSG